MFDKGKTQLFYSDRGGDIMNIINDNYNSIDKYILCENVINNNIEKYLSVKQTQSSLLFALASLLVAAASLVVSLIAFFIKPISFVLDI